MKAAVYYGPNKLEVADVPEPEPTPGTVKVKVGFNGICGTDLHEYYAGPIFIPTEPHPLTGQQMPLTMGHEFSGVITGVGDGVTDYAEGDRVAIMPLYRCGHCPACNAGNYNICAQIGFHGLMSDGGMAEYTVVPTDMLHRLPDNVSLELGALVEPMSVAYHAATLGDPRADGTAMVFGAGPIGIGLWFALRGKGVDDVFVVEPSATRRAAIEALGASTLDPTSVDVPAFIAGHTGGKGADAVYDAIATHDGQRRDLREAADHTAAQPGDERVPHPGVAVLHGPGLRGGDRSDGPRHVRHHRLGDADRDRRRHRRGLRGTARRHQDEGPRRSVQVTGARRDTSM
jgi:(R,R)-butanediol dehydrogenase/meso-butanediol dehydrogenase/diacetyl reductase